MFTDDIIGSAIIDMNKFIGNTNQQQGTFNLKLENVPLYYKGESAGTILLSIRYVPLNKKQQNQNLGMPFNPLNEIKNHLNKI